MSVDSVILYSCSDNLFHFRELRLYRGNFNGKDLRTLIAGRFLTSNEADF